MDKVTINRATALEALLALRILRTTYEMYVGKGDSEKSYWESCKAKTDAAIAEMEGVLE